MTQNPPDADRLGVCRRRDTRRNSDQPHLPPPEETEVTEEECADAKARLVTQGNDPDFLIRPVVLAEVQRARQETAHRPATVHAQPPEVSTALEAPQPSRPKRPRATAFRSLPGAAHRPEYHHRP